jgi:hypothetical protein
MKYIILVGLCVVTCFSYIKLSEKEQQEIIITPGVYTSSFYQACLFANKWADRDYIPSQRDPNGTYKLISLGNYPEEFKTDNTILLFGMGQ